MGGIVRLLSVSNWKKPNNASHADILNEYIIKSKDKLNASNFKTYYKCCIEGEVERKKNCTLKF